MQTVQSESLHTNVRSHRLHCKRLPTWKKKNKLPIQLPAFFFQVVTSFIKPSENASILLSDIVLAQLQTQVGSITRDQPFIATELRPNWVEPILRCQIQADYSETEDRFEALTFLKML